MKALLWIAGLAALWLAPVSWALSLSTAERDWLRQHPVLRVGVVPQAPYAVLDARRQALSGAHVELMNRLAAELGLKLAWTFYPNKMQLSVAARAGRVDVAPGLEQTPAGLRYWLFSDPFLRVPYKLVGRGEPAAALELEQLPGSALVAVLEPGAAAAFLAANYPALRRWPAGSDRSALQQVLRQRADYAVVDEAQLNQLLREPEFSSLRAVGDSGTTRLLRVASRQDWPQLATLLDRALSALPASQRGHLYTRWVQAEPTPLGDSLPFWRRLSQVSGLLILLLAGALLWQGRQQRQVRQALAAARQALAQREASAEALRLTQFSVDHSTVGILWLNWDSRLRYANQAALAMLGCTEAQAVGQPLSRFQPGLDMDGWLDLWSRARGRGLLQFEIDCQRADGDSLPVDVSLSFLRFGGADYLVAFMHDVSEKRQARAALRESEARFKGIAGNVPGLVFRLERGDAAEDPRLAFVSEASLALTGYRAADLLARPEGLQALAHPEDAAGLRDSWRAAWREQRDWSWQGRILTRDGAERWADLRASARRHGATGMVWDGILWDISAGKRNELELIASRAMLRDLSAHLETVREEEKAHIAREVHDELGQVLTVLKLETSMLELSLAQPEGAAAQRLASIKKLIAQTFALVRDVATALRPPILDAGLASAVEWQARRFEARSGIPCLVLVPETPLRLDDAKAVGLFRVLQEALTNVMRHAEAHTVTLHLQAQPGELTLSIVDDGKGFERRPGEAGSSYGLVGMRERLLMFGGSLEIASAPGQGCSLTARLPLRPDEGEEKT
ncbi:PAS domain-containing sensor histidine kinase [Chromobacterium haemolyticum]|uniref:PAS domain-containing sensor histidine kinase n=1 Tax=Chromobacterium haemolyticum TaxID=394935 RepID=UPI00058585A9|nr:sensor histidine kinase [Chromobacterium haemolyticum]